jgi:RNA polymerase sigma-70 factor (ECF subfamily)
MGPNRPRAEPAADDRGTATPAALFRAHAQAVLAICLANTRNYHDAEDIMQAVFLKTIAKASSLREPARVRAWLLQVARHMCVDFHRKRKQAEPLLEEPSTRPPSGSVLGEHMHEAIQKLPQNYREAIALYYLDGRNCSSVAVSLGTTATAVRQRLVRARAMLHDLLQEERT